jgi:ParB family chromosome partitioning protein
MSIEEALDRMFLGVESSPPRAPAPAKPKGVNRNRLNLNTACREIAIDMLVDLEQPFHLYGEEAMEDMRRSVSAHGVLQRLIVRPYQDKYQIISGRNRRTAARLAGFTTVPCEVRELDDDEAELQMIEANLQQRIKILPSEKAWAYRMRLEAMKRQGQRTDLISPQGAAKFRSDDELGKAQGISGDTVQRYIRLTYLLPELLACVDEEYLGLTVGGTLSFLTPENQSAVYRYFFQERSVYLSQALASAIREAGESGPLTEQLLAELAEPPESAPLRSVSLPVKPLKRYFKAGDSRAYIIETVEKALDYYFKGNSKHAAK